MVETNTWFRDGRWYRKADGTTASGWLQINGDWYYFESGMTSAKQEYYWKSNGKTYVFRKWCIYTS